MKMWWPVQQFFGIYVNLTTNMQQLHVRDAHSSQECENKFAEIEVILPHQFTIQGQKMVGEFVKNTIIHLFFSC